MSNLTPQQTEAATLPLTQALGRFVADIAFARLPEAAVKTARLGFTDCIGTMIAGSPEPCVQILKKTLANGRGGEALPFVGAMRGSRGGVDQRHGRPRSRLRRRRPARAPERRARPRHPRGSGG